MIFRYVALVTKKWWAFFLQRPDFFPALYPTLGINCSLKVTKFYCNSDNMRVHGQKKYRAGQVCLGLKAKIAKKKTLYRLTPWSKTYSMTFLNIEFMMYKELYNFPLCRLQSALAIYILVYLWLWRYIFQWFI